MTIKADRLVLGLPDEPLPRQGLGFGRWAPRVPVDRGRVSEDGSISPQNGRRQLVPRPNFAHHRDREVSNIRPFSSKLVGSHVAGNVAILRPSEDAPFFVLIQVRLDLDDLKRDGISVDEPKEGGPEVEM